MWKITFFHFEAPEVITVHCTINEVTCWIFLTFVVCVLLVNTYSSAVVPSSALRLLSWDVICIKYALSFILSTDKSYYAWMTKILSSKVENKPQCFFFDSIKWLELIPFFSSCSSWALSPSCAGRILKKNIIFLCMWDLLK